MLAFFYRNTATPDIYTFLHTHSVPDAVPISCDCSRLGRGRRAADRPVAFPARAAVSFPSRSCGEYGFAGLAEGVEGGLCDVPGVEAGGVVHGGWTVLVLEAVGQVHGAELEPVLDAVVAHQPVEHARPEAAERALLDGDQHLMRRRQPRHEVGKIGRAHV